MLTPKENMRAQILGTNPDRFTNQYEAMRILLHPGFLHNNTPKRGEMEKVDPWGVTFSFPENVPAQFPVHTPEKVVVKDIEEWKEYVKVPSTEYPDAEWDLFAEKYNAVDTTQQFKAAFWVPGIFEQLHHLCSMEAVFEGLIMYPDELKDLIKAITERELKMAEQICSRLHPDMLFHHDDWGSAQSTFFRPEMFAEFFVEPYKQIYGYYKDHGCEFVVHHSDSYAATLVPYMIEMGIDVWQGCMSSNDVPELVSKYGGQISFMGDLDNKDVDFEGWTPENCKEIVNQRLNSNYDKNGLNYFIPCIIQGGPGSVFPGVYMELMDDIDHWNADKFGLDFAELNDRKDVQIMF